MLVKGHRFQQQQQEQKSQQLFSHSARQAGVGEEVCILALECITCHLPGPAGKKSASGCMICETALWLHKQCDGAGVWVIDGDDEDDTGLFTSSFCFLITLCTSCNQYCMQQLLCWCVKRPLMQHTDCIHNTALIMCSSFGRQKISIKLKLLFLNSYIESTCCKIFSHLLSSTLYSLFCLYPIFLSDWLRGNKHLAFF